MLRSHGSTTGHARDVLRGRAPPSDGLMPTIGVESMEVDGDTVHPRQFDERQEK